MTVRILDGECRERLREQTEGSDRYMVASPAKAWMARDRIAGDAPAEDI